MEKVELACLVLCVLLSGFLWQTVMVQCTEQVQLNVLFAYDEEMEHNILGVLTPIGQLSAEDYIDYQMKRVSYRFNKIGVNFIVIDMVKWDSDDSYKTCFDLLSEAIVETGFVSGLWHTSDHRMDIFVAWTMQETPDDDAIGLAFPEDRACIVADDRKTLTATDPPWLDDNLLQHEISHILGAPDHLEEEITCVMGQKVVWINWVLYPEDLRPVLDKDQYIPWILGWIPNGYLQNGWCQDCTWKIQYDAQNFLAVDCPILSDVGYKPAYHIMLLTILIVVAISVGIILVIRRILKRRRKP